MKNARFALLAVTAAFLLVITGIFIGRNSENHHWILPAAGTPSETAVPASHTPGKLDLNTADAQDFELLPGIGDTLAQRIIDFREENGAFSSLDDLMQVSGIGKKKLDSIRQYLTVGG